jgi:hypothetical protein
VAAPSGRVPRLAKWWGKMKILNKKNIIFHAQQILNY